LRRVTALLGAGASVGLILPFSRSQESEADHLGLIYMAKAGYHPIAARDLWTRLGEASKGGSAPEAPKYYQPR
jgi:predicted Zn-dependent protease